MTDNWTFNHFEQRFNRIEKLLIDGLKEIKDIMTTQQQFDAVLTQLGAVVTNEDSTIATALTAISAAITALAANAGPDLTQEATAAQAMIADIQTQTASLATAVTNLTTATPGQSATANVKAS